MRAARPYYNCSILLAILWGILVSQRELEDVARSFATLFAQAGRELVEGADRRPDCIAAKPLADRVEGEAELAAWARLGEKIELGLRALGQLRNTHAEQAHGLLNVRRIPQFEGHLADDPTVV